MFFPSILSYFYVVFIAVSDSSDGRKYLQKEYNADLGLFYVELPDGTVLSHTLEENEVFPAQFGREVRQFMHGIATLLNTSKERCHL